MRRLVTALALVIVGTLTACGSTVRPAGGPVGDAGSTTQGTEGAGAGLGSPATSSTGATGRPALAASSATGSASVAGARGQGAGSSGSAAVAGAPGGGSATTGAGPSGGADLANGAGTGSATGSGSGSPGGSASGTDETATAGADGPGGGIASGTAPGVSETEIHLGVLTTGAGSDEVLASAGFGGISYGDTEGNWRAIVDDLNARGGVAGRTVVPVFHFVDLATTSPETDMQAGCTKFTEDQPVFAVASDYPFADGFGTCMEQAGRPVIYPIMTSLDAEGLAAHPLTFFVAGQNLSRLASALPGGLASAGYFEAPDPAQQTDRGALTPTRVGLVRVDGPTYERAAHVLRSALAAQGFELAQEIAVTSASNARDTGTTTAQMSNAVLQFRAEGITHVLFFSTNASEPVLFMNAADSQGYRPRYGFSSQDFPTTVAMLAVPSQLPGAVGGVSWAPQADVNEAQDPGDVPDANRCLEMLRDAGQSMSARTETTIGASECDAASFFKSVLDRATELSAAGFVTAAADLGAGFVSAQTWATDYQAGRRDGATVFRTTAYDTACSCFNYTSGNQPLPR